MLYETLIVALSDYTIDQRGDIGSYVRMAAILAAGVGIEYGLFLALDPQQEMFLITRICSLAIEKLDRVRLTASLCLQRHWKYIVRKCCCSLDVSRADTLVANTPKFTG